MKSAKTAKNNADSNSIDQYAIRYTDNNVPYVEVDADVINEHGFKSVEELEKTLTEALKEKYGYGKGIYIAHKKFTINSDSRKELKRSKDSTDLYKKKKSVLKDKYLSLFSPDEILKASKAWVNEDLHHDRNDNIVDFARGYVNIKVRDKIYKAEIVVGHTSNNDLIFYDLINLKKQNTSNVSMTGVKPPEDQSRLMYEDSIPNNIGRTEIENAQNSEQSGKFALRKDIAAMNKER